jgi:hypothetical protein
MKTSNPGWPGVWHRYKVPQEYMGCDIRPAYYVFSGLAFKKRIKEQYDMTVKEFIEAQARGEIR